MKKDVQIGIRMPSELRDELKRRADAERRSLASYIVVILEASINASNQQGAHNGSSRVARRK